MKKVMILAVVAAILGLSAPSVSAQVPSSSPQGTSTQEDDQTPATQPGTQGTQGTQGTKGTDTKGTGSNVHQGTQGTMGSQYTQEVKPADIPAAITKSLNEQYPGYKTEKVFKGVDGTYKVSISKENQMQTLFLDERGVAVKMVK